jgi:hypothetical protein
LIQLAIGTVAEASRDVAPDAWRRTMTLVLDGLRAASAAGALPAPALDPEQIDVVTMSYATPRRRAWRRSEPQPRRASGLRAG